MPVTTACCARIFIAGELHWVTGGGSGIGRCVAHEPAALGATVVISGRSVDKLERVAAEIREDGGQVDTRAFDIRDEDQVRAAVAGVVAAHGRIHGLVNNAGGQFPATLQSISKRGFETVIATNLIGGFLMAREVFVQSMQAHGGTIVNLSADMWNGMPGMGHSGAARAGMVNLTKTVARRCTARSSRRWTTIDPCPTTVFIARRRRPRCRASYKGGLSPADPLRPRSCPRNSSSA